MNIVFILGNGFDINLQLKTEYKHFLNFYNSNKAGEPLLKRLKKDISRNLSNWADFETELGRYTINFDSFEEFEIVYTDLLRQMDIFFKKVELDFDQFQLDDSNLIEYLKYPENYLPNAEKLKIGTFKANWNQNDWKLSIFTFNYTRTLEKYFNNITENVNLGDNGFKGNVILKNIYHIHGIPEKGFILGVNDESQILNKRLLSDSRFTDTFIKPDANTASALNIDIEFQERLTNANLICVYGSSLGATDNYWWKFIGKELLKAEDKRLIIFTYQKIDNYILSFKNNIYEKEVKRHFLKSTNLNIEEQELISSRIFVRTNTNIFKDLVVKN